MNAKSYLKENFINPQGNPLTDKEATELAAIIGEVNSNREIDEMVMYQEYYGVNLPIFNKHLVIRVEVNSGKEEVYQSSTDTWI
jgi:hypothetical protein